MGPSDPSHTQAAFAATVVDEWARGGLAHAVVCPGSRSTPMALALAAHPAVHVHGRLDERSAAFTALGIGLATGRPAAVLTTSGTATAELHAAVVEADQAGVPLIACTADRPPELHDVGAHQTIDQARLFGSAVRWFCDPGVVEEGGRGMWRSLGARVVGESTTGPRGPGPVHLNLPFREPLLGEATRGGGTPPGRAGGFPWHAVVPGRLEGTGEPVAELLGGAVGRPPAGRGLVVAGGGSGDPIVVLELADALGWPVLADPRSGLRLGHPAVVAAADGILRAEGFAGSHLPDVVLHLGDRWLSRVVNGFVSRALAEGAYSITVDPFGRWPDPGREGHAFVRADPTAFCRQVVAGVGRAGPTTAGGPGDRRWREDWRGAEARAQQAIDRVLGTGAAASAPLCEPSLARRLVAFLPGAASLVVSSSMPVRDVEAYAAPRPDPPRVLANRGANGIDGVVSTAIGVAIASGTTVALVGDLAFLHDVSALVGAEGFDPDLSVVIADNGGGGIFSFLDVATRLQEGRFDQLFGTPQSPDVAEVAAGFGWPVDDVDGRRAGGFEDALSRRLAGRGPSVIRVRLPDRSENVAAHRLVNEAVASAVDGAGSDAQQGRGS